MSLPGRSFLLARCARRCSLLPFFFFFFFSSFSLSLVFFSILMKIRPNFIFCPLSMNGTFHHKRCFHLHKRRHRAPKRCFHLGETAVAINKRHPLLRKRCCPSMSLRVAYRRLLGLIAQGLFKNPWWKSDVWINGVFPRAAMRGPECRRSREENRPPAPRTGALML